MRRLLPVFAVVAAAAAPAFAQTAPQAQPAPAAKPKTETKVVCERVNVEETTGSRLGSAPKVCKKVQVPVKESEKSSKAAQSQEHSAHAH
jgi:hypothetical protein